MWADPESDPTLKSSHSGTVADPGLLKGGFDGVVGF